MLIVISFVIFAIYSQKEGVHTGSLYEVLGEKATGKSRYVMSYVLSMSYI